MTAGTLAGMTGRDFDEELDARKAEYRRRHARQIEQGRAKADGDAEWANFLERFLDEARALGERFPQWGLLVLRRGLATESDESVQGWSVPYKVPGFSYSLSVALSLVTDGLVLWPYDPGGVPRSLVNDNRDVGPLSSILEPERRDGPVVYLPNVEDEKARHDLRRAMMVRLAERAVQAEEGLFFREGFR